MPLPLVVMVMLPDTSCRANCVAPSDEPTLLACTLSFTLTVRLLRAGTVTFVRLNRTLADTDCVVLTFFRVKVTFLEPLFTSVSFFVPV